MIDTTIRRQLLASTIIAGSLVSVPAFAQVAPATPTTTQAAGDTVQTSEPNDTIVVTGTLIANPNLTASSPVTSVSSGELQLRQTNTAEQILRDIPGVVPGVGQQVNNGNAGRSEVDLRGLGSNRNIVLLDGARIVPGGTTGVVDLNSIPTSLIDRVDVLTGGASATYGADAITGVVNFVTKRNFAGVGLTASEQVTGRGDANVVRTDLTIGANFDDGRGNVVLSLGYQQADPLYQGDRQIGLFAISSTTGRAAGASNTSTPTAFQFDDGSFLQVNSGGTALVPQYQGFNFNPYNVYQTPFKRLNLYSAGHYQLSDKLEVYSRGVFSRNTVSSIVAPSGIFGNTLTVPGNNPFLTPAIRDQICVAEGLAPGAGPTCGGNPALPLPVVYRRTVELGPRVDEYTTTFYDFQAGFRAHITPSLVADVYGSYGENENTQVRSGYVSNSRVQQALNATNATTCIDPSNGCVPLNIFGPSGSITAAQGGFIGGIVSQIQRRTALSQVHGTLSGDVGVSSPFADNPISFAVGGEYRKYTAFVRPDNLAAIPGELGGAGGAILPLTGGYEVTEGFGELIAPIASGKPGFELLQLEGGVRFSHYKVFANSNPTFNTTTYKAGGQYAPFAGLKFRGDYQHALRAPNISELFAPNVVGLTNLGTDPCAGTNPVGNANLTAICRAQGATAVQIGVIQQPSAGQVNETSGGNVSLRPEIADTFTVGAIFEPKNLIPGLTISADYYNIKLQNAITNPTPGDVIAACFNNPTPASATSAACTSIRRNPASGALSGPPTFGGLPLPLTNQGRLATDGIDIVANYRRDIGFAKLNLSFNGNWTNHSRNQATASGINRDCVGYYSTNCGLNGSIQPKYQWNQRTTLGFDMVDVSLLWRHIDSVRYEGTADDFAARGFTVGNRYLFPKTATGTGIVTNAGVAQSALAGGSYNFNYIKAYDYFDLSARIHIMKTLDLTLTGTNIFDRKPPLVGAQAGSTSFNSGNTFPSTYDVLGRRFGAQIDLRF